MSLDYRTALLSVLLDCGTEDVKLLEGCNMYWENIKKDCILNRGEITLNNLLQSMFNLALDELNSHIQNRIDELSDYADENPYDFGDAERTEFDAIENLDVFVDISTYCYYGDTEIKFIKNKEAYEKYFSGALDEFEEQTGFKIE